MSQEPTAFELCLPGIVAGLVLATVVLTTGEPAFPHAFQEVFRYQPFEVLPVTIGLASGLGLMSLTFYFRAEEEERPKDISSSDSKKKNSFPPGGTDAL